LFPNIIQCLKEIYPESCDIGYGYVSLGDKKWGPFSKNSNDMFPLLNMIEMSLANSSATLSTDSANIPLPLFPNLWKFIIGKFWMFSFSYRLTFSHSSMSRYGFAPFHGPWGGGPLTRDRSDNGDRGRYRESCNVGMKILEDGISQPQYRTLHDLFLDLDEFFDAERLSSLEELKANSQDLTDSEQESYTDTSEESSSDTDNEPLSYIDMELEERSANPSDDTNRCHCTIL